MLGLENKNKNIKKKNDSTNSSDQAKEAQELLAALNEKKKDKPDDCVFC